MRLFLSSQDFGNHIDQLLKMVGDNKKVLYVDNAKDYLVQFEREERVAVNKQLFEQAGLEFEELDLREYFGKKELLQEKLKGIGLLFMAGGNTFILRRAMKYSGLDDLIVEHMMRDDFVYGGSSAGSIVVVPDLHGVEHADDPDNIPEGYKDEVVWVGLNLVDFYVIPHYLSDWFGDRAHKMEQYFKAHDLPYEALMDGQVYIVDGVRRELLT